MPDPPPPPPAVAERFKPTSGNVVGLLALTTAAAVVVSVAIYQPNLSGLRIGLAAALVGVLVWVALLRPRARAHQGSLVLQNMFSDTYLPLDRVDAVVVRHVLAVWIGDERYICVGIGRSTRSLLGRKGRGPMAVLGIEQDEDRYGVGMIAEADASRDYATFVETRIEELSRAVRRDRQGDPPEVRRAWALPEIVLLGVLSVVLLVTLLF